MYTKSFGQDIPADATVVTTTASVAGPGAGAAPGSPSATSPVPTAPTPAASPIQALPSSYVVPNTTSFAKYMVSKPGQPYVLNVSDQQVEEAVYKTIPTAAPTATISEQTTPGVASTAATDPSAIVQLDNGLQIPQYILNRDIQRKQSRDDYFAMLDSQRPPQFYKIGNYSNRFPAKAAIIALLLGLIIGKLLGSVEFK